MHRNTQRRRHWTDWCTCWCSLNAAHNLLNLQLQARLPPNNYHITGQSVDQASPECWSHIKSSQHNVRVHRCLKSTPALCVPVTKAVIRRQPQAVFALCSFGFVVLPIHFPVLQNALSGTCAAKRFETDVGQCSGRWLTRSILVSSWKGCKAGANM